MKKPISTVFFTLFSFFLFASEAGFKVYLVPKSSPAMEFGNMTEEKYWAEIPVSSDFGVFPLKSASVPQEKSMFQATYNLHGLFLRILCSEKLTNKLDFTPAGKTRDHWNELSKAPIVEIFLDPLFSRKLTSQFGINIKGCIYDKLGENTAWDYPVKVKSVPHPGKQQYSVFCFFSWQETNEQNPIGVEYLFVMTPRETPVIGFNLAREQIVGGGELSQWNRTERMFNQPAEFGALVLSGEPGALRKMLLLFTDSVLKNGVEFEGTLKEATPIFQHIFHQKINAGKQYLAVLPELRKKKSAAKYQELDERFAKAKTNEDRRKILSECIGLNSKLKKMSIAALETELFNEF